MRAGEDVLRERRALTLPTASVCLVGAVNAELTEAREGLGVRCHLAETKAYGTRGVLLAHLRPDAIFAEDVVADESDGLADEKVARATKKPTRHALVLDVVEAHDQHPGRAWRGSMARVWHELIRRRRVRGG